jgi:predicted nucleic acid-binding protein
VFTPLPVIEVDLLLAYLVAEDRHHEAASNYFSKVISGELTKPILTPFALQELELGVRAQKILPHGNALKNETEIAEFMNEICEALELYEITILPIQCGIFARAAEIRKSNDLSYYDSHHASAALYYDKSIVSTDRQYDRVKDLKRIDPSKLAGAGK